MAKKSETQQEELQGVKEEQQKAEKKKEKGTKVDEALIKENEALKEEAGQFKEAAQRIQAEFDNYRRRSLQDGEQRQQKAVASTVQAILPALDSMDEAVKVYSGDGGNSELKEGIEKVRKQLLDSLSGIGVTPMECDGAEFDPNLHEAVMMQDTDDGKSGVILTVFRKGYMFKEAVIRHAQVIVSK